MRSVHNPMATPSTCPGCLADQGGYDHEAVARARPRDFEDQVLEHVRSGLATGMIGGVALSEGYRARSVRYLASKIVGRSDGRPTPLPPSLTRLSEPTRALFTNTWWNPDTNRARSGVDRIVIATAALEYARAALGVPRRDVDPRKPETKDPRLLELCAESVAAFDALWPRSNAKSPAAPLARPEVLQ